MKRILPTIVIAQFFCTSLWFAGNAIIGDIITNLHLEGSFLAHLTSAVQFGFITGTFVFALLTIADRFSPSRVFFVCAILAASVNLGVAADGTGTTGLLLFRFATGFFLAGIYPVGMKIAADHYEQALGKSLGFLVGALVLGTAFPHLIKSVSAGLQWKNVVFATSVLSTLGGVAMLVLVPDGPFRKPGQKLQRGAFLSGFKNKNFRAAAFGYFGHMWELYTFWAFVPVMLTIHNATYPQTAVNVPLLSFAIIACGSLACVASGLLSIQMGVKRVATNALSLSFLCCCLSPFFLSGSSSIALVAFLFFWGLVVIADSPLFSTLVAQNAPSEARGTSLTIVNCIGFSITIVSIQLTNRLSEVLSPAYLYTFLAVGPLLGLVALLTNTKENSVS